VPKDIYPFADQVYEMYKTGYLKSFSVRFDPVKWEDIAIDENARRAGVRQRYGREYKEQDLLEISAVNIPANPEAMANKDYQDFIVKSFIADNLSLIKDQTVKDSLLKGEIKEKETIDLLNEEIVELKKRIELFESIEKNITELKNETEAQTLIKKCQEGITLLAKIGSK
jgi:hypothetical protein